MWLDQRTRVGTLRVRGAGADVPALRLATAGRLQTAALELPASAPPSAVLLVRRLRDPLPGRFPHRGAPAPDRDWNRAARADLASLYRIASRPRRGVLPADAPAVVFRDEAELIAVAALHLARHGDRDAWWWRALARFLPAAALAGVAPLLAASPRQTASALAELYRLEREAPVLARLDAAQAEGLLAAVAAAHSLPAPSTAEPGAEPPAAPSAAGDRDPPPDRPVPPIVAATLSPPAPWRGWLPRDRASNLAPAQELLLAVAVGLEAAPATLRRGDFWRHAGEWKRHRRRAADPPPHRDEPATVTTAPETPPEPTPLHDAAADAPPAAGGRAPRRAPQVQRRTHAWERIVEVAAGPAGDVGSAPTARDSAPAASPASRKTVTPGTEGAFASLAAGDDGPPAEPPHGWPETGVVSALGGVFYLVHPLRLLDLPAACEADWELASRLGGWGTLDALARALAPADAAGDPLWRLLAQLAGREADEPPSLTAASDLTAPRRFEPPAAWIADLGLTPAAGAFDATLPTLAPLDPHLLAWLAGAVPWAAAALLDALGEEGSEPRATLSALLRLPCALFATATHVDVVAALDGISLPARRAGLDRDPGWVPRLGCIVQLHFR